MEDDAKIRGILESVKVIAVVGWSPKPERRPLKRFLSSAPVTWNLNLTPLISARKIVPDASPACLYALTPLSHSMMPREKL